MSTQVHTFPKLYKLGSLGSIQEWKIWVVGCEIHTSWGVQGGKFQKTVDIIKEGKNVGRSNETTPEEQALAEALSKWELKTKKKYVQELKKAEAGESYLEGGYDPMLAHKFAESGHKITYPAYVQPKLDGHRCPAVVDNGVATLWSRTRKPIYSMPHIIKELQDAYPDGHHELDGELYNHRFKSNFEHITSLIRQDSPAPDHADVQYHIYDKRNERSFRERTAELALELGGKKAKNLSHLILVETEIVADEDGVADAFERFTKLGYEGAMVRNAAGLYVGKRSYDLLKVKEFDDAEFPIVNIVEGRGKLMGHAIFVCETTDGKRFEAKLMGDTGELKKMFDDHSLWKDKLATVKYQGFTKYGIPRFPVAMRIRKDT